MRNGCKVAIIDGRYKGQIGRFLKVYEDRGVATMLVQLKDRRIDVHFDQMRPLTRKADIPLIGWLFR